jgi:AraC-like DNA-binding protein
LVLSSTGKGITEAAFESGFSSSPNFYRRFKGKYGVPSAEFRRQLLNKEKSKLVLLPGLQRGYNRLEKTDVVFAGTISTSK